jgi:hypothetical protein
MNVDPRLAAEQRARVVIDQQLEDSGWLVQDRALLNLFAGPGVAVREAIMAPGHGRADYLLYVDQRTVGIIEAKPEGTPLSGVEWQSAMYAEGLPAQVRLKALTVDGRLPFVFEASPARPRNAVDHHRRLGAGRRSLTGDRDLDGGAVGGSIGAYRLRSGAAGDHRSACSAAGQACLERRGRTQRRSGTSFRHRLPRAGAPGGRRGGGGHVLLVLLRALASAAIGAVVGAPARCCWAGRCVAAGRHGTGGRRSCSRWQSSRTPCPI